MTQVVAAGVAESRYAAHVNPQGVRLLTQVCGNNFMVLKVAPPLVVSDTQMDEFITAIHEVVELAHSSNLFRSEALGLARRVMNL